jgi:preprotein translocase subunit SecD
LKPSAAGIFAEATKINLDKAIAIVIDDQVFYWPVVRNVIEGGKLEVTGNLSEKDVNYFLALVNTDILPLSFTLVK